MATREEIDAKHERIDALRQEIADKFGTPLG